MKEFPINWKSKFYQYLIFTWRARSVSNIYDSSYSRRESIMVFHENLIENSPSPYFLWPFLRYWIYERGEIRRSNSSKKNVTFIKLSRVVAKRIYLEKIRPNNSWHWGFNSDVSFFPDLKNFGYLCSPYKIFKSFGMEYNEKISFYFWKKGRRQFI